MLLLILSPLLKIIFGNIIVMFVSSLLILLLHPPPIPPSGVIFYPNSIKNRTTLHYPKDDNSRIWFLCRIIATTIVRLTYVNLYYNYIDLVQVGVSIKYNYILFLIVIIQVVEYGYFVL